MDLPHPQPPFDTPTADKTHSDQLPPVPTTNMTKLRLMCSYGGHIVPRPNNKSLFYAGGETRIVALDRSTTASSLESFTARLSRTLFNNRPFHLKYQLPNEDLDSLISVTTDEDLSIMLEEHDRLSSIPSAKPSRIRLFLFPVKPESLGSALLDPKSETWFSDALNSTRIVQRGQSADSGFMDGLIGLDMICGPVESQVVEGLNNVTKSGMESVGGGSGGGAVPESMVLETSSSFGSTGSSFSMSNLPPIGVQSEEADKKVRVLSSASLESEISVGSAGSQPKPAALQEPCNQVVSGPASFTIESEIPVSNPSMVQMRKAIQVCGIPISQQVDGKQHQHQHQHEVQYMHGNVHYVPPYSTGHLSQAPYYPVYQMSVHQPVQGNYSINQPYPVYLVPVRPVQAYNVSMHGNINDNPTMALSRPPSHPQPSMISLPVMHKELISARATTDSMATVHGVSHVVSASPMISAPSSQGQQQFMAAPERAHSPQPLLGASVDVATHTTELDDSLAYTQIYKSQPSAPVLSSQYLVTKVSESAMHTNTKHQVS